MLEPTRGKNVLDIVLSSLRMSRCLSHWDVVITTRYMYSSKQRKNGIDQSGTGNMFTKEDIRT